MSITFKDVLRAMRKQEEEDFPGSVTGQFQDHWLEHDDDSLWNKIADDSEKAGRSREETFYRLILLACYAVGAHDPEHGYMASPLALQHRRQLIEDQRKLADFAAALAKYYRSSSVFDRADFTKEKMKARADFFEGEAKAFQEYAAQLAGAPWESSEPVFPRQRRSRKRKNAGPRRAFVRELASDMQNDFKKRYSAAVAVLTDIAFPDDEHVTTAKEVDDICRDRSR